MKKLKAFMMITMLSSLVAPGFEYETPADFPLMGELQGKWIEPERGHEKVHPNMVAQLLRDASIRAAFGQRAIDCNGIWEKKEIK